ncbi:glutamate 2,3-aminomutase [Peptococcaceae bacterium]|nr:glutamate 2,3-aminomutase [Peptococcaceae bacterium]
MNLQAVANNVLNQKEKREISLNRAMELRNRIADYTLAKEHIYTGFDLQKQTQQRKNKMLKLFGATEKQWDDWKWQIANRIKDVTILTKIFDVSEVDKQDISKVGAQFRWAISPYYASIMDNTKDNPVWLQAVPDARELTGKSGIDDPMGEEFTSPAPAITRRYPDRLIINVTNQCAMYCRHCQRRRDIGEIDSHKPKDMLEEALAYIRDNQEIRDVLITGGDALLLSDSTIDWLLAELNKIKHVEIKRLGTRTLVTMPQRITPELCAILDKYPPIYINTQFNHPQEITPEVKKACDMLIKSGVVLGNQAVLLKNINNNIHVMKKLNHELLKIRVRPYYIFHAKEVTGTEHFITPVDEGMAIMEKLRGYTSGLAVPTYIINAPNGYGKTPVLPQYVIHKSKNRITLRTWEKRVVHYKS